MANNLRRIRFSMVFGMLGLVVLLSAPAALHAQDQATIVGTVTDASGAVIPNARVTVSNPDRGFIRNLLSDSAGAYVAAKVPIGNYIVTVEASGFQKLVRNGIVLQVGQLQRVDLRLQVGQATQLVTVTGNVPKVQTDTGTISHVINGTQMVDLDLNGRGFTNLELLVPGASEANNTVNFTTPTSPNIAFNGMRSTGNRSEIDGAGDTDMGAGGASNDVIPSIDSIAEFRISTNNYGADMGQAGGSIIEIATKSGTRQFHGGAYEFVRNTAFNANDFFQNRVIAPQGGNAPEVPLHWNDPGYYIGGPFYIPGIYNNDKSKTFFFWSQEFHRYRTGSVINTSVPTLLERQGNFSQCDKSSSNYNPVVAAGCILPKNPATGALYPNDTVPVNPDATDLLNAFIPLPNSGPNGYVASPSNPTNFGEQQIRVDQNISDKTSLFVRFTHDAFDIGSFPGCCVTTGEGGGQFDTVGDIEYRLSFNTTLHLTHSFTSRLMNEFLVGYTSDGLFFQQPVVGPSSVAGSFTKPSNWTAGHLFAANETNPRLPEMIVSGGVPSLNMGAPINPAQSDVAPTYQAKDNLVDVVGNHTLKTGFLINQYRVYNYLGINTAGVFTFTGGSSPISTGNGLADMDIGAVTQYEEGSQTVNGVPVGGYPKYHYRNLDFEPYFEDDWKVNHKLTLNLGVRYYWLDDVHDYDFPGMDVNFVPSLYNPAAQAKLNAAGYIIAGSGYTYNQFGNGLVQCGSGGIPLGCTSPTRGTVAPRFGFAFDPTGSGKSVIRGGYGIFYDIGSQAAGQAAVSLVDNPPVDFAPSAFFFNGYNNITQGNLGTVALKSIPDQIKYTAVQQFNLTVQHEFPGNNLLSVAYVGTLAHHIPLTQQLEQIPIGVGTENVPVLAGAAGCDAAGNCNVQSILEHEQHSANFFVPYQNYSSIISIANVGNSNYNALQVSFTHPFGHGLLFQAAYAWSHWLDDGSASTSTCIDSTDLERCYANSDLNRPQSLVLNYVYALPFFRGSTNKFLSESLGGWRLSGITSFFSGLPFTPSCGVSGFATGIGGGVDCNSLAPLKVQKGTVNYAPYGPTPSWFAPGAYGQPLQSQLAANDEPGMFGYLGRNVLSGPGRNDWDLALLKDFSLPWFKGESSRLEFRVETFNTFNTPQWATVSAGCAGNTTFGQPCSGSNNPSVGVVTSDWPARVLQLGLKLTF